MSDAKRERIKSNMETEINNLYDVGVSLWDSDRPVNLTLTTIIMASVYIYCKRFN